MLVMSYIGHCLALEEQQSSQQVLKGLGAGDAGFLERVLSTRDAWLPYILSLAVLVPVGPWEVYLIFPTNDKILAMKEELEKSGKEGFGGDRDKELDELLVVWGRWHWGRVVIPLVATGVMAWGVL